MTLENSFKVGVEQKVCPIRPFLIIQPENKERLLRAMKVSNMLWGGRFAPILPFYAIFPMEYRIEYHIDISEYDFYANTIANFDPDIIFYDDDIDVKSIEELAGERQFFSVNEFMQGLLEGQPDIGISILEVIRDIEKNEFKYLRSDGLKFVLPSLVEDDLLLHAFVGSMEDTYVKIIQEIFEGNDAFHTPELDWSGIENYHSYAKMDITDVSNYKLNLWSEIRHRNSPTIYLLRSDRINDVINYWNLRAAGWQLVPVPVNLPDLSYFKGFVERVVRSAIENSNSDHVWLNVLHGFELSEDIINSVCDAIIPNEFKGKSDIMFSHQGWFPRFWREYYIQKADHIKAAFPYFDTFFAHYDSHESRLSFTASSVPFESKRNFRREAAFKVTFNLSIHDEYAQYAELLSGINNRQMKQLVQPFDFRNWRLSAAGFHRLFNRSDKEINLSIPGSLQFFKMYFGNRSHRLSETANSKLANQVLKNLGGLHGSWLFLRSGSLKVIELFEGGKIISFVELIASIKKNKVVKNNNGAENFIYNLLSHKIIEMGGHIQCTVCNQHGFFLPGQLNHELTCPICRNSFKLPMTDPSKIVWSYRGIGPFSRTNKADGVMAVFAALKLFHEEFTGGQSKISSLIGFELTKSGQSTKETKEVDLGVILENQYDQHKEPDLLFCECKTYKRFNEKDMERLKELGDEFSGAILVLATLNEHLDDNEISQISNLVKYFQRGRGDRPRNPVLILTGKEMLLEDHLDAFDVYKNKIKPYHRYNDFIGSLCELTIKRQLNIDNWWDIREKQWQTNINKRKAIGRIIGALINKNS